VPGKFITARDGGIAISPLGISAGDLNVAASSVGVVVGGIEALKIDVLRPKGFLHSNPSFNQVNIGVAKNSKNILLGLSKPAAAISKTLVPIGIALSGAEMIFDMRNPSVSASGKAAAAIKTTIDIGVILTATITGGPLGFFVATTYFGADLALSHFTGKGIKGYIESGINRAHNRRRRKGKKTND